MLNKQIKHRVSDEIGDNFEQWERGDIVSISSGTGSGKSYFVKNVLSTFAKQQNELILYLVPRTRLKEQIEEDLKQKGITNITVKMYQSIEASSLNHGNNSGWLSAYKYVVCDESHYFLSDSQFNDYTDISLEEILTNEQAITILLSATGESLLKYIERFHKERKLIKYFLPQDYSYIKVLSAYQSEGFLFESMDWLLDNNHKSIVFIQSDKKAFEAYKKYEGHATFVCGKDSSYYKYVDEKKVDSITKKERFDSLFLIATSVLDVGVNIEDEQLHHVIIDMVDTDTLIQCLGRKRLVSDEDYVHLLVKDYNNQQLGGFQSKEKKLVEDGKVFFKQGVKAFAKHNNRKRLSDIFYFDETGLNVNKMKYIKSAINLNRYTRYVQQPQGYLNEVANLLSYKERVHILDYLKIREDRMKVLEKYDGIEFYSSKDAKEILKELNFKNQSKKQVKDFSEANKILVSDNYPFEFKISKGYIVDSNGDKKQTRIYTLLGIRQNGR